MNQMREFKLNPDRFLTKQFGTVIFSLTTVAISYGQGAELVADINPGPGDSDIREITASTLPPLGSLIYFAANDGEHGSELWKFDGSGNAQMVRDIHPGEIGSNPYNFSDVHLFTANGDTLVGNEPYRFEGNTASLIQDVVQEFNFYGHGVGSSMSGFTRVGNTIYSKGYYDDGTLGGDESNVLFRFDGVTFTPIDLGPFYIGPNPPENLYGRVGTLLGSIGGDLYYSGNLWDDWGLDGPELWKYDGATATVVANINPEGGSIPGDQSAAVLGDSIMFFVANDGEHGNELWSVHVDGTVEMAADLKVGSGNSDPKDLVFWGSDLYFTAHNGDDRGIWRYGLNDPEPVFLRKIDNYSPPPFSTPTDLTVFNNALYFTAELFGSGAFQVGRELYKYDGDTMVLAANINPVGWASANIEHLTVWDGNLYFSAYEPEHGQELWRLKDVIGITEPLSENTLRLFPNPIQGKTVLEYDLAKDETITINLFDMSGKLVQNLLSSEKRTKGPHKESIVIDTSLPTGTYTLTIENGARSSSVRLVK